MNRVHVIEKEVMVEEILIKDLQVAINKTFFGRSVIYIEDESFRGMPDKYVFILHYAFHGEKPVTEEHPATKQGATR